MSVCPPGVTPMNRRESAAPPMSSVVIARCPEGHELAGVEFDPATESEAKARSRLANGMVRSMLRYELPAKCPRCGRVEVHYSVEARRVDPAADGRPAGAR